MTDPWVPDTDCETHEWRNPLGETIRFVTRTEAEQRMMPPVTIHTVRVPQAQGGRFRHARHEERFLTLPVVLPGPTAGRTELRRWAKALDPLKGEGTITVVQGDYPGRQLVCAYEAGLESFAEEYPLLGLTTLMFRAADPYWQDSIESQVLAQPDEGIITWFPFLPLELGASDVFSGTAIENTGDVDAWPIVTVTGPGLDVTVANRTTGQSWQILGEMVAGETLVVDHRPGHKTVRLNGATAFGELTDTSSLWPLVPGGNHVEIVLGAVTEGSSVLFTWRNRWLAA